MKNEIIELAKQAGFERLGHDEHDYVCYPDDIVAFATLVAFAEREACAKVCEELEDDGGEWDIQQQCANAIRARGANHEPRSTEDGA